MTSALDGGGWSTPRPGRFTRGKTRYPLYRRLGRPQGRSGLVRKISPTPGFDPRTVQPVASRYTDWAIPAAKRNECSLKKQNKRLNRLCQFCEVQSSLSSFLLLHFLPTHFATLGDHLVRLLGSASPAWNGCTTIFTITLHLEKKIMYTKELISTVHYWRGLDHKNFKFLNNKISVKKKTPNKNTKSRRITLITLRNARGGNRMHHVLCTLKACEISIRFALVRKIYWYLIWLRTHEREPG